MPVDDDSEFSIEAHAPGTLQAALEAMRREVMAEIPDRVVRVSPSAEHGLMHAEPPRTLDGISRPEQTQDATRAEFPLRPRVIPEVSPFRAPATGPSAVLRPAPRPATSEFSLMTDVSVPGIGRILEGRQSPTLEASGKVSWEEPDTHEVKPPDWAPEGWTDPHNPWRRENWRWGPSDLIRWRLIRRFLVHDLPLEDADRGLGVSNWPDEVGHKDEPAIKRRHGPDYDLFWWRPIPMKVGGEITDEDRTKTRKAPRYRPDDDCVRGPFEFWCPDFGGAELVYRVPMIFELADPPSALEEMRLRANAEDVALQRLWESMGEDPFDEDGALKPPTVDLTAKFCEATIAFLKKGGVLPSEVAKQIREVLWGGRCDDSESRTWCKPDCIRHGRILKLNVRELNCSNVRIRSALETVWLPGTDGKWENVYAIVSYITYLLTWNNDVLYEWWCERTT